MSEFRGPLTIMASVFEDHARLPPPHKKIAHAGYATELLTWCVYGAPIFEHQTGTPFTAWAAVTGFTVVWLVGALWRSRGQPRDFGVTCGALFFGGGAAALLWFQVYPDDWGPFAVFVIRGIYWSVLTLNAAHLVVALQLLTMPALFGGSAMRRILRHIRRRSRPLRPARPRSF
jgi:hypothetical protein